MHPPFLVNLSSGCITQFHEKPTGDDLAKLKSVSKNATEQNPFEASMGIYVFKRDVLVSPAATAAAAAADFSSASRGLPAAVVAAAEICSLLTRISYCLHSLEHCVRSHACQRF